MDINRQSMDALFKSYNTAFTDGMARGRDIPAELQALYPKLSEMAMIIPSNTGSEVHTWLCQIPGFREWVGDRVYANIQSGKLEVANKDWESTIPVPRNDIQDDKYGLYAPLMSLMGAEAADDALWLDIVIDALLANGKWSDDAAFFGTTRKYGANTISNKTTNALSASTFETACTTMESYLGHNNRPLNVTPVYLLVGPSLRTTAWDILNNQFIASGTSGAADKVGAVQNRNRGRAILRVHPKLTGTYASYWYLFGQKSGIRPLALQRRKNPEFVALNSASDEHVFKNKEFLYGADARGTGFLTMPHLAYLGQV